MATPFIDALTDEQRAAVARRSRGEKRPSYYSAALAESQDPATTETEPGRIQISEDLEAVLILLPGGVKQGLIEFIQASLDIVNNLNADDFALFSEVLEIRSENYAQVNADTGSIVETYDDARSQLIGFIETTGRQNTASAASSTSVVIPDLGTLFGSLAASYAALSSPDELAIHDRIADSGFVYTLQDAATSRSTELSSWVQVIQTYTVT
jgi:hypothetical protein